MPPLPKHGHEDGKSIVGPRMAIRGLGAMAAGNVESGNAMIGLSLDLALDENAGYVIGIVFAAGEGFEGVE